MNDKHHIHRLLQLALIEIRHEAQQGGDPRGIAALADLFHNVPLRLAQGDVDYGAVFNDLAERARGNEGLSAWLKANAKAD